VQTDVRIVAATNRNLERMIADGRFRSDLYFRIKVVEIKLPPLRERGPKDIERLAQHFAAHAAKRHGRPGAVLSPAALVRLGEYPWPGNVRELENVIESAVVISEQNEIGPEDLPRCSRPTLPRHAKAHHRAPMRRSPSKRWSDATSSR
jgi:Nif-specific regulatory protein